MREGLYNERVDVPRTGTLPAGLTDRPAAGPSARAAGSPSPREDRRWRAFILLVGTSFLTFVFVGTLCMQQVLGFSALATGAAWVTTSVTIGALAGVAERDAGVASGLLNTAQNFGGAFGVAVASSIAASYSRRLPEPGLARGSWEASDTRDARYRLLPLSSEKSRIAATWRCRQVAGSSVWSRQQRMKSWTMGSVSLAGGQAMATWLGLTPVTGR